MTGDDELFAELGELVSPPFREPPAASVAALHAAVARQFRPKVRRPWWRRRVTAGAAVFGVIAGAPAAAFAISGAPLPVPLRTAMHAVGLPVDSVPVADTKRADTDLEHALESRDAARIGQAAIHLRTCLAGLDRVDQSRLAPHADSLLRQAAGDIDGRATTAVEPSETERSGASPSDGGGSVARGGDPSVGSSTSGSSGDGSSRTSGSPTGSGEGDQASTGTPSATPTTSTIPASGSSDGSAQPDSASTTAPVEGQSATTDTTVPSGVTSDGGGSSSSDGGSGGDSTTATTTDPSR